MQNVIVEKEVPWLAVGAVRVALPWLLLVAVLLVIMGTTLAAMQ